MVSVIIPNYNHAPYLKKRIDSVINQTYQEIEVVIMDDCSTDNSREIIDLYKNHPKVTQILYNTTNSGSPFLQWQKAFSLITGDIIWIAESDDYADLLFLEKLLPGFNDNKVGVVYCDSNVVDADEVIHPDSYKQYRNERFQTRKWSSDYNNDGIVELRENLFYECTINNMSATLFRKSLLQSVDLVFLQRFRYCGDWFFLVSLSAVSRVAYIHEALSYFKYGTDNFKAGTRSVLNYFRERALVRYYFWEQLQSSFSSSEKKELYKQMGSELQIQLNEALKGKTSRAGTFKMMKEFQRINVALFTRQLKAALRRYLWKS